MRPAPLPSPRYTLLVTSLILCASTWCPAQPPQLEEVTVMAQRVAESAQETPISLAAFEAADMEVRGIAGVGDMEA